MRPQSDADAPHHHGAEPSRYRCNPADVGVDRSTCEQRVRKSFTCILALTLISTFPTLHEPLARSSCRTPFHRRGFAFADLGAVDSACAFGCACASANGGCEFSRRRSHVEPPSRHVGMFSDRPPAYRQCAGRDVHHATQSPANWFAIGGNAAGVRFRPHLAGLRGTRPATSLSSPSCSQRHRNAGVPLA